MATLAPLVTYAEAGGYEKREEFQECDAEFRIAMKPAQRRVLPETGEGSLLRRTD